MGSCASRTPLTLHSCFEHHCPQAADARTESDKLRAQLEASRVELLGVQDALVAAQSSNKELTATVSVVIPGNHSGKHTASGGRCGAGLARRKWTSVSKIVATVTVPTFMLIHADTG